MAEIAKTTWNGFPAYSLESERMRVLIVPDLGAKIVSLHDKAGGREWLAPPMRPVRQTAYGGSFVDQDMSGWDEMLPTIVSCRWQGVSLPDHGEVWSIPWRVERAQEELRLSVDSPALPYRFTRAVALPAPDCLELRYSVANLGGQPLPYLWAAHPQFAAGADTRILLPPEVTRLVNVIEADPVWGAAGAPVGWPAARSTGGQTWALDRVRPAQAHACRKFYLPPEQPAAWAGLLDETTGCELRLEWSPTEIPYLGLWVDEGAYNSIPVAALEPSNGYYDSLVRAIENRRVAVLQPGAHAGWTLRVRVIRR